MRKMIFYHSIFLDDVKIHIKFHIKFEKKKEKKRRSGGARWAEICPPLPVPPPLKMLIKHNQRKHIEYTFFSQQKFHQIL